MGWDGNVWTGAKDWVDKERLWDQVQQELPAERVCEVRYESLLENPPSELARICRFLDVEYDDAMLSYPEHTTYEAPDSSLAQQWQRKLTPREVRLVESLQRKILIARGYELSGMPPLEPGRIFRGLLRAQSKSYRIRFRFRRQGPRLFLADTVSKRLGMKSWRRSVIQRVNENTKRYLK